MKEISTATLIVLASLSCFSQSSEKISLSQLHKMLEQNHPIASIKTALDSSANLQVKNINAIWFPKVDANATATWQSDVIEFNIPFPGITIPSPDPDQYKLTLDATQIIWDGGATKARKELAYAQNNAEKSGITNELYALRERVNDAFFGIIILDITENQLRIMLDELKARLESIKSGIREGVVLESSQFSLHAEILRLEQRMMEIPSRKVSLISVLESLTGITINEQAHFTVPEINDDNRIYLLRPELQSFTLQKSVVDAKVELSSKRRMPTIAGFVTAGYGKPGLNMLSNEWDTYVVAGAKLSWSIWDWNITNRERQILMVQSNIVDLRKQAFEDAINMQITSSLKEIETIKQQMKKDEEIIELLEAVKAKSASQLANGTISSTEYLADFNSAARAKLDLECRKMMLVKEKTKLCYLKGEPIE
jgi:outer membrane protein TolC